MASIKPGDRFGRLTVVRRIKINSRRLGTRESHECRCDCGNVKEIAASSLYRGLTTSCGCGRNVKTGHRARRHGYHGTRLYSIWTSMKQRCNNPNREHYVNYGGRGVRYHPSFETFEGFLAGIPEGYQDGLELDRIDNDGDYAPGNLKWSTRVDQANNRRDNKRIEDPRTGDLVTIAQLSRRYPGVTQSRLSVRLQRGVTGEDLIRPVKPPMTREQIVEVKRMLWSLTTTEVSVLTGLTERHCRRIRDQDIHSDISEFE